MELAREFGLAPNVVEKDYVLGWLLAGISQHTELSRAWVFKGGTCLKKCFFETYRFSEDLDFTVTDASQLDEGFLTAAFAHIARWIYDEAGIELPEERIRFEVYENPRGHRSVEGRVAYRGPLRRRGDPTRVKLDLTDDEAVVLDPVVREVHHPYSDRPAAGIHIPCYCLEEVFAEKLRALAERERPRDLYDVVHLYRHDGLRPDRALLLHTLEQKCAFKRIALPTMDGLQGRPERVELEGEWHNMLAHQLPVLPPFEQFWQELPALLAWLYEAVERAVPAAYPVGRDADLSWRPPAMAQAWHAQVPLEVIRFAAANHLCVDLAYQGTRRLIEPYSLRRSRAGHLLLHAVKHETGQPRSYRVDRIQGAIATDRPFVPRYAVELTATGPVAVPATRRNRSSTANAQQRARRSSFEPTYIVQCVSCGRRFNHKTTSTRLNKHNDRDGYPCPSRSGFVVETRY